MTAFTVTFKDIFVKSLAESLASTLNVKSRIVIDILSNYTGPLPLQEVVTENVRKLQSLSSDSESMESNPDSNLGIDWMSESMRNIFGNSNVDPFWFGSTHRSRQLLTNGLKVTWAANIPQAAVPVGTNPTTIVTNIGSPAFLSSLKTNLNQNGLSITTLSIVDLVVSAPTSAPTPMPTQSPTVLTANLWLARFPWVIPVAVVVLSFCMCGIFYVINRHAREKERKLELEKMSRQGVDWTDLGGGSAAVRMKQSNRKKELMNADPKYKAQTELQNQIKNVLLPNNKILRQQDGLSTRDVATSMSKLLRFKTGIVTKAEMALLEEFASVLTKENAKLESRLKKKGITPRTTKTDTKQNFNNPLAMSPEERKEALESFHSPFASRASNFGLNRSTSASGFDSPGLSDMSDEESGGIRNNRYQNDSKSSPYSPTKSPSSSSSSPHISDRDRSKGVRELSVAELIAQKKEERKRQEEQRRRERSSEGTSRGGDKSKTASRSKSPASDRHASDGERVRDRDRDREREREREREGRTDRGRRVDDIEITIARPVEAEDRRRSKDVPAEERYDNIYGASGAYLNEPMSKFAWSGGQDNPMKAKSPSSGKKDGTPRKAAETRYADDTADYSDVYGGGVSDKYLSPSGFATTENPSRLQGGKGSTKKSQQSPSTSRSPGTDEARGGGSSASRTGLNPSQMVHQRTSPGNALKSGRGGGAGGSGGRGSSGRDR